MNTDRIKDHFENEAAEYDEIIKKLIPYYNEMIKAVIATIHFNSKDTIKVIDLGCGTGTLAYEIKKRFPNAVFTCVDIAEKMLEMAQYKLGNNVHYINADFANFEFPDQYDLIIFSLALHHLYSDEEKLNFYHKIHSSLTDKGLFINADVILGTTGFLQESFIKKWIEYMEKSVSREEIENKWLPSYYAEDRPVSLMKHLNMLSESGFKNIDVIWKYYNYAVYTGQK